MIVHAASRTRVHRLLLLAPPGAGKGTQAKRLSSQFGLVHISSGELLRQEVAAGTEVGKLAKDYLARGDLVPDDVILDMVLARVCELARSGGYVLDGFPRTVSQAEAMHRELGSEPEVYIEAAVHLAVSRGELRRRLLARSRLEGRADDTERTIEHRLDVFDQLTKPLLAFYDRQGLLVTVDGEQDEDRVTSALLEVLEGHPARV